MVAAGDGKSIEEMSVSDIRSAGEGLLDQDAHKLYEKIQQILSQTGGSKAHAWSRVSQEVLTPSQPFGLHQLLYYSIYRNWDSSNGPPPAWIPSREGVKYTNLGRLLEFYGTNLFGAEYKDPISSFTALHQLSVLKPEVYWRIALKELGIPFIREPSCILDLDPLAFDAESPGGVWLPGAYVNAADFCLEFNNRRNPSNIAVMWRDEGEDDAPMNTFTLCELKARVVEVARSLEECGFSKGDAIAIDMPMTVSAVIIYLGIVLGGFIVVSIADSFAASEIETRLNISKAKGVFTQDFIIRGGKKHPLYIKVVEAKAPKAIVLPTEAKASNVTLRQGDIMWDVFLALANKNSRLGDYKAVACPVSEFTNILFSSGTTGEPKAIPWTHATPIKAAADAWAHLDIRAGDVVCWPTNLGWMMGPWLIYAALVNGAAIALYNGSPLGYGFGKFIQDTKTTMLGIVPSIVRAWRRTDCMNGLDWSNIRCFSSTGEASAVDDYLWLMGRAGFKPVIEYCGGTEIGGAFATGSLLQAQALAAFSTPAMGCRMYILDEQGHPIPSDMPGIGECAFDPSMIGSSTTLLNANHFNVYFKNMPRYHGKILRRHGDEFERTIGGYYKARGRVDDTMNLGGIKVSSVEIERICNLSDQRVLETAAIGIPPAGGGPENLLVVVVLKDNEIKLSEDELKHTFNLAIQQKLNPLFKVSSVAVIPLLPRTASNKVMRRTLRSQSSALG
ncbi:hypothetical protein O6H91_12G089700 [Diphasiastrum complanatum]|uniref:Uncharacterized protein n=1 Tax=Diphasiastrum complanatum TaxID=34168 RepID=A0ACC2C5M2_DIPCM|nr:hypothetical protein O6H91_12G089700 [Diphasiastrum complanatum]